MDIVNCRIQALASCPSDSGFMSWALIEMLNDIEDNNGGFNPEPVTSQESMHCGSVAWNDKVPGVVDCQ